MSDTAELELLATRAAEAALTAGAGDAEAFVEDSVGREIRVFGGTAESLTEAQGRGLGLRAWLDGRSGYAYGTDLTEEGVRVTAAAAVDAARIADPDEHAGAPGSGSDEGAGEPVALEGLSDPSVAAWETSRKIDLALAVEAAAREADERVSGVEETVYAEESERAAIATSTGRAGAWEATSCYAFLQAHAGSGEGKETGMGFGIGRGPAALDPEAIGREAAERATALLGAEKPGSRSCPVLLDPTVAASFVGFIGSTLCADTVQRGRSPFAGRLGEAIASGALTLTDDGTDPEGLASAPLDGEGTPRRGTALIETGTLATYLHDSYTARREGGRSTGNASRSGYRSAPKVSTSNLIVAAGERSFEELLGEAGSGVYVTDVAGLHSGVNPVSGNFSVGAEGLLIEGGELGAPASGFTIASDLISMLRAVTATASEPRWVPFGGSVRTPAILIGEMAVGGT